MADATHSAAARVTMALVSNCTAFSAPPSRFFEVGLLACFASLNYMSDGYAAPWQTRLCVAVFEIPGIGVRVGVSSCGLVLAVTDRLFSGYLGLFTWIMVSV